MEISNVSSSAYTSAAAAVEDDEELKKTGEQETEVTQTEKEDEGDKVELSTSSFDADDVEEKANNYLQNILFFGNLTEESKAAIENYMNTFDVDNFIDMYGPFTATAEVSAAMYATTSGLVKQQEE
jgi:predicted RNA-binding protein Jag